MEFENYLKDIEFKVIDFCRKYNFWHHKEDLLSEAFICFKKCKEKFKGDAKDFKKYFLNSLDNHFLNYYKRESRLICKDGEELEIMGVIRSDEFVEEFRKIFNKLTEEEIWFINLLRQGFKLKEVSEKLGISYEKVKDI